MLKKIILTFCVAGLASSMMADINGNGYYRVKNYGSNRWADLIDNHGSVDMAAVAADLHALELTSDFNEIITQPGSIIYLDNTSGSSYNVSSQGTSLQSLVNININIRQDGSAGGQALYRIYGSKSGTTAYIRDGQVDNSLTYGKAAIAKDINNDYINYIKWEFYPIDNTTNYFAAAPSISAGGNLYTTLYASFAYQPFSQGVKAYYIANVANGMVEMIEINGTVPAESPVIIQGSSPSPADNKLQIVTSSSTLPSNKLTGVYFDYKGNGYDSQIPYDPQTMRVLGVCKDGSLGFITSNSLEFIPANTAYLKVPAGSPEEYKCVDSDKFIAGVDNISSEVFGLQYIGGKVYSDSSAPINVISLNGTTVASAVGSIDLANLPKGIYIANCGGKSLKIVK